jgi:hypothetical protein
MLKAIKDFISIAQIGQAQGFVHRLAVGINPCVNAQIGGRVVKGSKLHGLSFPDVRQINAMPAPDDGAGHLCNSLCNPV